MEEVKIKLDNSGEGYFYIDANGEELAQMVVTISGGELTAHHTDVFPKGEGKGLGKKLLAGMAQYVRKNGLKVSALCPFVYGQFKRHPQDFGDIIHKSETANDL
ncbi:MAG TPA: N-acetyltransferase [Daejeonella sp.]|nr:N-acetyltransferase [Daejeonella sp.]